MNSEEIEDQFQLSKTVIPEDVDSSSTEEEEHENHMTHKIQDKIEIWRLVVLVIGVWLGVYCFLKFLPIEFIDPEDLWNNYTLKCCSNDLRCSIHEKCENMLNAWLYTQRLPKNILDTCCYWHAPYSNWRIYARPFCNQTCLKI